MSTARVTFLGTGAGNCIHRAHTAIVLDCPGGTRLLLDCGSGNSALRHGAGLGMLAADFNQMLLTHHHPDHIAGLPFIQGQRHLVNPNGAPVQVYTREETLEAVKSLFRATTRNLTIDQDGAVHREGQRELAWRPCEVGQWQQLGEQTRAACFPVNHVPAAVGWRIETNGLAVVFSGDTRFSEDLIAAAHGADVLIHEALCTDADKEGADRRAHATAGDAARAAALAGVSQLILTHIDTPFHFNPQPLVDEARQFFDGPISVAGDLYQATVSKG